MEAGDANVVGGARGGYNRWPWRGGPAPPTCGPAQDRPAVSSRLYVGCHRPGWSLEERLTCHLLVSVIANAWLCNCLWSKRSRQEGRLSPAPYLCLHRIEQLLEKDVLRCRLSRVELCSFRKKKKYTEVLITPGPQNVALFGNTVGSLHV